MMQTSHIYQLHSMTHRGLLEEKERRKVLVGFTHPNLCLSQVAPPTQVMAAVRKSDSNFNLHQKCLFCFSLSSTRATPPSALCFIRDPESVLPCGSCRRMHQPSWDHLAALRLASRTSESARTARSSRVTPCSRQIREKRRFQIHRKQSLPRQQVHTLNS